MTPSAPARPSDDSGFRAYRMALIDASNDAAFGFVAVLVVAFNAWDWYIDPDHAGAALGVRLVGGGLVLATGLLQRKLARIELAPRIAKLRLLVSSATICLALALLDDGFLVGLSGLVIAMLGAAYSAIDRRDLIALFAPPVALALAIMAIAQVGTFVFVNATCFLLLTIIVGWLLARVMEDSYRRSFELEQALLRESRIDPLTGVLNRRALEEQGFAELSLCRRHGQPYSVLMIDIDHFKDINDRYGHPVGDQVLRAVAAACRGLIRDCDRFGRWGGEEFLALLPETPGAPALALAERMRHAVAQAGFEFGGDVQRVTVSIGVAGEDVPGAGDTAEAWASLVKAADVAMYAAKGAGRNRVALFAAPVERTAGSHPASGIVPAGSAAS
jgi:diguanylate cyclase (GGDEF)-like protein